MTDISPQSSPAPSAGIAAPDPGIVTGHGVTLTFPVGWVNVPATPDKIAHFMQANAAKFPHLRTALKSQLENVQNLREMAMLVYRLNARGTVKGVALRRA